MAASCSRRCWSAHSRQPRQPLHAASATAGGSFELGLSDQIDIKKGYRIAVLCYSPEGDDVVSEGMAR